MKSLFSRFRTETSQPPRSNAPSRNSIDQSREKSEKEEPILPPKRLRPSLVPHSSSRAPTSHTYESSGSVSDSIRPHNLPGEPDSAGIGVSQVIVEDGNDRWGNENGFRPFDRLDITPASRHRTISDAVKKVTFKSPAPTPTASIVLDEFGTRALSSQHEPPSINSNTNGTGGGVSRLRKSSSPTKSNIPSPTRSSNPTTTSSQSRPGSRSSIFRRSSRHASSLNAPLDSPTQAFSPTPSDTSGNTGGSGMSYLPIPHSWSETIDDELIANLGPRERTRQEVLWEIVSSEERYVNELAKMNETFCRALLPPSALSPSLSLESTSTLTRVLSPISAMTSLEESLDHLPIAARYATHRLSNDSGPRSPDFSSVDDRTPILPSDPMSGNPRQHAYNILTHGRPGVPPSRKPSVGTLPRSHQSLPPPLKTTGMASRSSAQSKSNRHSSAAPVRPQLPEDLRDVLATVEGMLEGHTKLVTALKKRYDNQYPLVRSLADVFTSHSYILRDYATYVLHLERALEQVNESIEMARLGGRRGSRRLDDDLGRTLLHLEDVAAEKGEAGLSISLSKPFQRLLKYPLLFQNLLFNTDPSTREYEATLAMVDEVEKIVRSIEDEKSSSEVREQTRDLWARIEGIEDRVLMAPKPDRLIVSETPLNVSDGKNMDMAKQKKSNNRLSDILKTKSTDLWIVRFNDVSLLCQRIGTTTLPFSAFKGPRSESSSELGKARNKRLSAVKPRNLYKFVKIHEWHLKRSASDGVVSMRDISEARSHAEMNEQVVPNSPPRPSPNTTPHATPTKVLLKDGDFPNSTPRLRRALQSQPVDDSASFASDHISVMSFAFKGAEVRPRSKNPTSTTNNTGHSMRAVSGGTNTMNNGGLSTGNPGGVQRRNSGGHLTSSAANAKFAHRLRSNEPLILGDATIRPNSSSKTRRSLPPAMATKPVSALGQGDKTANARPAWNSSTRPVMNNTAPKIHATVGSFNNKPSSITSIRRPPGGAKAGGGGSNSTTKTSTSGSALAAVTSSASSSVSGAKRTPMKPKPRQFPSHEESLSDLGLWATYQENGTPVSTVRGESKQQRTIPAGGRRDLGGHI